MSNLSTETTIFTTKELEVLKLKLSGMMNREIAQKLNVSEEDVSQTLSNVRQKIRKVEDSIRLFERMELIESGPRFKLTEEGKRLLTRARVVRRRFLAPVMMEAKRIFIQYDDISGTFYTSMRPTPFQPTNRIFRTVPWLSNAFYPGRLTHPENLLDLYTSQNN